MGPKWLNERNVAILCGVILLSLSVGAVLQETGVWNREQASLMSPTTAKATPTQPVAQTPAPAKPETKTPPAEPQLPASYNYVAQSGDSYTMFIRDALNQYLNAKKISATPEQMFSAEVTLLSEANSPLLDIGQQVSIPQQSVTNALRSSGVAI